MNNNSHKRLSETLNHKEPDRIPFDLGGALVCGINVIALKRLKEYLGLNSETKVFDKITQIGEVTSDVIDRLKIDIINVAPNPPSRPSLAKDLSREDDYLKLRDEFGIEYRMPVKGGHFYDIYKSPLSDADSAEDINNYPWPDPLDQQRFRNLKEKADKVISEDKKAYFLERMSAGMWENAMWMTGYEKFFTDMIINKKLVHAIMDKFLEIKCKYWEKALETVGNNVLVVSTADDLGTKEGMLVSLSIYKELIWPYHKKLFNFIKEKAKSKVYIFFHCDGAIKEAIPLLIEAGVDILNPLQVNCRGMNTKKLKKEFGNNLTFWGGSCDNNILSFGTPEEVREETKKRISDLAPGGGFVFAPIHIIQSSVPPENIMAWWEILQKYGKY
ncbi:MAG: uroporphyrinogen decarboxylase family protein [Actinomycetota bacterium]